MLEKCKKKIITIFKKCPRNLNLLFKKMKMEYVLPTIVNNKRNMK